MSPVWPAHAASRVVQPGASGDGGRVAVAAGSGLNEAAALSGGQPVEPKSILARRLDQVSLLGGRQQAAGALRRRDQPERQHTDGKRQHLELVFLGDGVRVTAKLPL